MSGPENGNTKLTLPFGDRDRTALPIAGGKAANLGELTLTDREVWWGTRRDKTAPSSGIWVS